MKNKEMLEHLKNLLTSRNGLAQEVNTEGDSILEAKAAADSAHKSDCPCVAKTGDKVCTDTDFQNTMKGIEARIESQKAKRSEIQELDKLIEAATPMAEKSLLIEDEEREPFAVTQGGMKMAPQIANNGKKVPLFQRIATDFQKFIKDNELTEGVGNRSIGVDTMKSGDKFHTLGSFNMVFGENQMEVGEMSKSILREASAGENAEKALVESRNDWMKKSMFTQVPGLSGGSGGLYSPTTVFAGNTGGLCEYVIDDTLDLLPYPAASFLDCLPVRRIPKSYVLFVRQTLRINNASAVNESAMTGTDNPQTPGVAVDFRPLKPESEFGFTQARANTLTFADTLPVSEEFLEDCPAIADAVENQLMQNVREEFYDQLINGDGSTGQYPELLGLLAQVGLSTRVHQGAATFMGVSRPAGAVTDDIRDTLIRASFDAEAYGYTVDCMIISEEDYQEMFFLEDGDDHKLYSEAELNTIRGAKVRWDVRMPAGTALVGAFRQVVQVLIRRAMRLDIGWIDKQFKQDMLTLRATMRGGLLVRVPHALVRVTGM